jgi:beta-lactamase class A
MNKVRIPLLYSLLIAGSAGALGYFSNKFIQLPKEDTAAAPVNEVVCNYHVIRRPGFEFVKPILFAGETKESVVLGGIKSDINLTISDLKASGQIAGASVYLRILDESHWTTAGDEDKYVPGSLMKVPELITFMKMKEKIPGLLDQKITYSTPFKMPKESIYLSKSIELGKTYSIRELLYYMIAYSDNYATALLNQRMDINVFKQVFIDLGIPEPDLTKSDLPLTAKHFSLFMRALYNGTYIGDKDSEFCTELLSHSDFQQGILNGLPKNIKVAHKFGEAGDANYAYLTESAIVYLDSSPYLLTIMAKNKDNKTLPGAVSALSKLIYDKIRRMS